MAARPGCDYLIEQVRLKIGDTATKQQFTDSDIQDALDVRRRDINYRHLQAREYIAPGGAISFKEFWSTFGGFWERNGATQLHDSTYAVIDESDLSDANWLIGRWTFSSGRDDNLLYITGVQYDVYGVAADLVDAWLAAIKTQYSFTSGTRSFQRSDQTVAFEALSKKLRSQQWIGEGVMIRTDESSGRHF